MSFELDSLNLRSDIDEVVGGILKHIVDKGRIRGEVAFGKVVGST